MKITMDSKVVRKAAFEALKYWYRKRKAKRMEYFNKRKWYWICFKKTFPFFYFETPYKSLNEMLADIRDNGAVYEGINMMWYWNTIGTIEDIYLLSRRALTIRLDETDYGYIRKWVK
jgi:hypothetical protein